MLQGGPGASPGREEACDERRRETSVAATRGAGSAGIGSRAPGCALAQPAPDPHSRGFHLFLRGSRAPGGRATPPGQSHLARLHSLRRPVPGLDLRRAGDAAPAERAAPAARRTSFRANPWSSITRWKTAGGGLRLWPSSWKTRLVPVDRSIAGATERDAEGVLRPHRRSRSPPPALAVRRARSAASISFAISIWEPVHPSVSSSTASRSRSKIKCWSIPGSAT